MIIDTIKIALQNMDKQYCELSLIDYNQIHSSSASKEAKQSKYLERPFAYEFYHQLRNLVENGKIDLGGPIVQAEVDKDYQHIFEKAKIPDFIVHIPNAKNKNLAILEFKLASRSTEDLETDLTKLQEFKKPPLKYVHAVHVLIGTRKELDGARQRLLPKFKSLKEVVEVIEFDTDTWKAS